MNDGDDYDNGDCENNCIDGERLKVIVQLLIDVDDVFVKMFTIMMTT